MTFSQAMILAAGQGIRLRPLTDSVPKALVEVGGRPLIHYHLQRLRAAGIVNITINVSHLAAVIRQSLGNGDDFGVQLQYSAEPEPLETAGGIKLALTRGLLTADAPFVCVNADIVCDYDFTRLPILPTDRYCHLVLVSNPPAHAMGDFSLSDGLLIPPTNKTYTYSGIGVYRSALFDSIEPCKAAILPLLQAAIAQQQASAEKYDGLWHDTGTPASLAAARQAVNALNKPLKCP